MERRFAARASPGEGNAPVHELLQCEVSAGRSDGEENGGKRGGDGRGSGKVREGSAMREIMGDEGGKKEG